MGERQRRARWEGGEKEPQRGAGGTERRTTRAKMMLSSYYADYLQAREFPLSSTPDIFRLYEDRSDPPRRAT